MRSQVEALEGVSALDIHVGQRPFTITYDPKQVSEDDIQAALDRSGYKCGPTEN